MTGKTLLAAVTVMQVVNTTCSQWPCRTQSSEFQAAGRVKVMFISSWDSLPLRKRQGELGFGSQKYLSNNGWDKESTQMIKAGSATLWSHPGSLQATKRARRKVKTPNKPQNPPAAALSNPSHPRTAVIRLLSEIKNSL